MKVFKEKIRKLNKKWKYMLMNWRKSKKKEKNIRVII